MPSLPSWITSSSEVEEEATEEVANVGEIKTEVLVDEVEAGWQLWTWDTKLETGTEVVETAGVEVDEFKDTGEGTKGFCTMLETQQI